LQTRHKIMLGYKVNLIINLVSVLVGR
jgi:hypothetical protein